MPQNTNFGEDISSGQDSPLNPLLSQRWNTTTSIKVSLAQHSEWITGAKYVQQFSDKSTWQHKSNSKDSPEVEQMHDALHTVQITNEQIAVL